MLNNFNRLLLTACLLACLPYSTLQAQSLRGSSAVMERQNRMAVSYGYSFLKTSQDVRRFVENGYLVKVADSATLTIHNVSFPYARPEVKLFLERLSRQHQNACGDKLVVTSLTRPLDKQPGNASDDSVHPTGMALDLRIPRKSRCRSWLQKTLLSLEKSDVLDVTRERYPPHYHVALFTKSYGDYVATLESKRREAAEQSQDYAGSYTVRRGDSLYLIAQRADTTVEALRSANNLRSTVLQPGQVLAIPGTAETGSPAVVEPATGQAVQVAALDQAEQTPVDESATLSLSREANYTVRAGDSLYLIAERHDTTIDALRSANDLRSNVLQVGQVLTLPGMADVPMQAFVGPTKEQILAVVDQLAALKNPAEDTLVKAGENDQEQAQEQQYTVRPGDSLYLIAERHDTTIEALRAANNLRSIMLQPGQVLVIPGDVETLLATTAVPELNHRVRRGDTLWEIASLYRISINRLKAMNGLNGDTLQVGQVLKVSGN